MGFIPIIKPDSDDGAEKERVRMLRDEVLQRCLAVLLDSFIAASETGVLWDLPGVGPVWVVPRVVLYAADQPEERHLLGLKLAGCKFQCSHCLVHKDEAGCPHDAKPARDVVDTVESQLSSAALFKGGCSPAVLEQISEDSSIVPIVPLLAAVHGLGTGSFALYDIFGFDLLHVRLCSVPHCVLSLHVHIDPHLLPAHLLGCVTAHSLTHNWHWRVSRFAGIFFDDHTGHEARCHSRHGAQDSLSVEGAVQGGSVAVWALEEGRCRYGRASSARRPTTQRFHFGARVCFLLALLLLLRRPRSRVCCTSGRIHLSA